MKAKFAQAKFPVKDESAAAGNPVGQFYVGINHGMPAPLARVNQGSVPGRTISVVTEDNNIVMVRLGAQIGNAHDGRAIHLATLID